MDFEKMEKKQMFTTVINERRRELRRDFPLQVGAI